MVKDVVSLRSGGNLHDKACPHHHNHPNPLLPNLWVLEGRETGGGAANVKGRSNVNDLLRFTVREKRVIGGFLCPSLVKSLLSSLMNPLISGFKSRKTAQ